MVVTFEFIKSQKRNNKVNRCRVLDVLDLDEPMARLDALLHFLRFARLKMRHARGLRDRGRVVLAMRRDRQCFTGSFLFVNCL